MVLLLEGPVEKRWLDAKPHSKIRSLSTPRTTTFMPPCCYSGLDSNTEAETYAGFHFCIRLQIYEATAVPELSFS
jgi:hypothetical protein